MRLWPFEKRSNYTCRPSFIDKDVTRSVSDVIIIVMIGVTDCMLSRSSTMLTASSRGDCLWRPCHLVM